MCDTGTSRPTSSVPPDLRPQSICRCVAADGLYPRQPRGGHHRAIVCLPWTFGTGIACPSPDVTAVASPVQGTKIVAAVRHAHL